MYDTHITHTTRCVFSMLSSQKHATRRRSAYNQHSYKLQAAYVFLRVDLRWQEAKGERRRRRRRKRRRKRRRRKRG